MQKILIIGGAGFIGSNAAATFGASGWRVSILDNLSRAGANENLSWATAQSDANFFKADIRDKDEIVRVINEAEPDVVLHLAGQVAVTTSVLDPRFDFEVNAVGTFNILEAIRESGRQPFLIFSSTNKVYGDMPEHETIEKSTRHEYKSLVNGVSEKQVLDFHSPYGCSKGSADQYVRDYSRIYNIPTVTLRQSCIYGPRQFGIEDQGWVAWFTIASVLEKKITIFGDGKQVRDVLHIDDLVRCYQLCIEHRERIKGEVYNIGGGLFTLSLVELLDQLGDLLDCQILVEHSSPRPGDQLVFINNIQKAVDELGWRPQVGPEIGVERLADWVRQNVKMIESSLNNL